MENNPTPPDNTLYQYRPPKQWAFDNFQERVVYFGAPRNFNDPHDFRPLDIKWSNEKARDFLKNEGIDDSPQNKMPALKKVLAGLTPGVPEGMTDEGLCVHLNDTGMLDIPQGDTVVAVKKMLTHLSKRAFTDLFIVEHNMSGVSCFSEHKDNALMWSRYAGEDKGFCLEFDASVLIPPLHKKTSESLDGAIRFRRVEYPPCTPKCDPLTWKEGERNERFADFLSQKSPYWSYEKEWRGFRKYAGAEPYGKTALKNVYLGAAADERTKALVYAIVKREYGHAKVFEAKRSDHKPAVVDFERYHPTVCRIGVFPRQCQRQE